MKILVTNDDGYMSKGLLSLVEILAAYGRITVVAPKKPQSGMSMAVSMGLRPIAVRELGEREGARWWYLDGTPASCIKFGIDNIFHPQVPDLVVSGINHGSNAATAALYSGTLGAAMEGAVNGIPSIGVSLDTFKSDADFSAVRRLLPGILDKLLDVAKPRSGMFYNINFPYIPIYTHFAIIMAFAIMYPDASVLLMFFLPLKAKWIAVAEAVIYLYNFLTGGIITKISIAAAFIPVIMFFLFVYGGGNGNIISNLRFRMKQRKRQKDWRDQWR